jgi:hypothetical protein
VARRRSAEAWVVVVVVVVQDDVHCCDGVRRHVFDCVVAPVTPSGKGRRGLNTSISLCLGFTGGAPPGMGRSLGIRDTNR